MSDAFTPEDEEINFAQATRRAIIGHLMPGGKVPDDKVKIAQITELLSAMDRSAIPRKRIATDKVIAGDQTRAIRDLIVAAVSSPEFHQNTKVSGPATIPQPGSLVAYTPKPGEMEVGTSLLKPADFSLNDKDDGPILDVLSG